MMLCRNRVLLAALLSCAVFAVAAAAGSRRSPFSAVHRATAKPESASKPARRASEDFGRGVPSWLRRSAEGGAKPPRAGGSKRREKDVFFYAALDGPEAIEKLRALVESGKYDVEGVRDDGERHDRHDTPLLVAAQRGRDMMVQALLAMGANVNARNHNGLTALMAAVDGQRLDVVETLLEEEELDKAAVDNRGQSALHHAASRASGEIVELLVRAGFDDQVKDTRGRTPWDLASARKGSRYAAVREALRPSEEEL